MTAGPVQVLAGCLPSTVGVGGGGPVRSTGVSGGLDIASFSGTAPAPVLIGAAASPASRVVSDPRALWCCSVSIASEAQFPLFLPGPSGPRCRLVTLKFPLSDGVPQTAHSGLICLHSAHPGVGARTSQPRWPQLHLLPWGGGGRAAPWCSHARLVQDAPRAVQQHTERRVLPPRAGGRGVSVRSWGVGFLSFLQRG